MPETRIICETKRSISLQERQYELTYTLGVCRDSNATEHFIISASLKSLGLAAEDPVEKSCTVDLLYVYPEVSKRIFDLIASAREPVFPVHVPEIVRDQIAATCLRDTPVIFESDPGPTVELSLR